MEIFRITKNGYVMPKLKTRKRIVTEEQQKELFKKIYNKEPTPNEFLQFKNINK
jgi:hypothetical protein